MANRWWSSNRSDGKYLIKLLGLDPRGAPSTLVPFTSGSSAVSRDGQLVAFMSSRSGSLEVYVQRLTAGAVPERVSTAGGEAVAWSRDGTQLLYKRSPDIMAMPFTLEGGRFRSTGARVWSHVEGGYGDDVFDIGPDGRVLVAYSKDRIRREIRVVINWQQEIVRKLSR